MNANRNDRGFVAVLVVVIVVILIIVFVLNIGKVSKQSTTQPSPSVSSSPTKADTVSKMKAIHNQLSASWQVCQIDPTKCQMSVTQVASANDVFTGSSSQYSGKTLDDFTGWKQNVGITEGDMKQWAVNASFSKDNSLLSSAIPSEIQTDQDTITSFTNDK